MSLSLENNNFRRSLGLRHSWHNSGSLGVDHKVSLKQGRRCCRRCFLLRRWPEQPFCHLVSAEWPLQLVGNTEFIGWGEGYTIEGGQNRCGVAEKEALVRELLVQSIKSWHVTHTMDRSNWQSAIYQTKSFGGLRPPILYS